APAGKPLAEHEADVGLEGAAVVQLVAASEPLTGARQDDRVVQLEADRHLLHRLEDHRAETTDGAEVEEPECAASVDEDVSRVWVGVVETVAQHLIEERLQQSRGEGPR